MYNLGNSAAEAVDNVFVFIIVISVILLVIITTLMIVFAVKYSNKRHPQAKPIKENIWLEVIWTIIPTILVLLMFFYGYEGFKLMRNVPEDALKIKVTGRLWEWSFEYENGKVTDKLYVPKDKNIKLLLKSVDVVHSFYIPAFRIKEDVVPGRETYMWFKPQAIGPADIFCAEFCGRRHAYMLSQVIVMEEEDFNQWLVMKDPALSKVDPAIPIMKRYGCLDCHSIDNSGGDRISLRGIWGATRTVITKGQEKTLIVDEAYLRKAITDPSSEIVKGFDDEMEKAEDLTVEQLNLIIQYLKTLVLEK